MSWGQIVQIGGNDVTDDVPTKWCFPNELNEIVIGRLDDSSSYILNKAYVSAKHLVIRRTCEGDGIEQYVIEDYSSNGTYINGELVGKGKCKNIRNNDQISFKFRGVEKLVFKFMINDSNEESEPPLKCQRIQNKRSHGSLAEIDISASKRINALEREIQQQDLRITNQSTKLESSAREYGNLQTTYLATREALNEKENELTEAKQTRLMLESSLAAMEARCRNLDDSVSNMKTQMDHQRDQLRLSEERATKTAELQMKLDNVQDELSHKKVQLESMSQVYEDLNVTYQREKRSREKLDEENKKYQAMMKQSEEEKFQYLTLNENLKKDLFFSQESSRLNEEKISELSRILYRLRKEWSKERAVWSRTCDSFISTTQLVYERAQEGKKLLRDSMDSTTDLERDLEKYLSNYSPEIMPLSQRPLSLTQSHHKHPHIVSSVPFTQIYAGPSDHSVNKIGTDGTEKSQGQGPLAPSSPQERYLGNSDLFGTQSEEKLEDNGNNLNDRQDEDDRMCLVYDQTNTISTSSAQYSLTRHGTICETYPNTAATVTQVPEHNLHSGSHDQETSKEIIPEGKENLDGDDHGEDQLSPTIHYSGSVRKSSSAGSGNGQICSADGSSAVTPSGRKKSYLAGWIDDSIPMNKTELMNTLRSDLHEHPVNDCKKTLEFSEEDNHLYDVDDEDDLPLSKKSDGKGKKSMNMNDSEISIGGMI